MLPNRARHPNFHFIFKGSLVDPRSRTSNEHIPIVRVPRAGGRPGYPSLPSKLACFSSFGRAPMLVYVRPSNEALLRARVPGAQDQRGCPANPFHRGGSASKKGTWPLPLILLRPRIARARGVIRPPPPLRFRVLPRGVDAICRTT